MIDVDDLPAEEVARRILEAAAATPTGTPPAAPTATPSPPEQGRVGSRTCAPSPSTWPSAPTPSWSGRAHATRSARFLPPGAKSAVIVTQEAIREAGWVDGLDPGVPAEVCIIPDGEDAKTLATVEELARRFARAGLSRADVVVAVGGGIVTDVAGFAAATYHRGTAYVNVATSLLAQVDAAIGGKTGVNLPEGKNLVGAFWQPNAVLCDTETLATLPPREWACGRGEIAKYAFLGEAPTGGPAHRGAGGALRRHQGGGRRRGRARGRAPHDPQLRPHPGPRARGRGAGRPPRLGPAPRRGGGHRAPLRRPAGAAARAHRRRARRRAPQGDRQLRPPDRPPARCATPRSWSPSWAGTRRRSRT